MYTLDGGSINQFIKEGRNEEIPKLISYLDAESNIYTNYRDRRNIRAFFKFKVPDYFYAHKYLLLKIFFQRKS